MKMTNQKGVALAITLLVIVVLITIGGLLVMRAVNEKNISDHHQMSTKAFYIAEAGINLGIDKIDTLINTDMLNTVNTMNPQVLGNKAQAAVNNADGISFLIEMVKNNGVAQLTLNGANAEYTLGSTTFGSGNYQYKIIISEKKDPVAAGTDMWDFFFYYQVDATGSSSAESKDIVLTGDFTVRVQRDNFAKYALFTEHHCLPPSGGGTCGDPVWFTNKTNFAGPIHTNDKYSFALNPSGTFYGPVTQQNTKAQFYNQGNPVLINASNNGTLDVPTFNSTYQRGVAQIVLASSVQKQDLIDQATGNTVFTGNGIFVANNGTALTGGIYVNGDATVSLGLDGNNGDAQYVVTQGSTTKTITVKRASNQTVVQTGSGQSVIYSGLPDGVDDVGTIIYVNGAVDSVSGTVQKDTEVTLSSENDIVITNTLTYEDYTPAVGTPGTAGYVPPNADGKTNLLGIVSWGGNVRVGTSAPNDVNMHGIMMARNGIFAVDSHNNTSVGPRGTATLLGGAITQFYGAFGLFNGSTGNQISGYGRNFVYDSRTLVGKAPPYFPTMKTFVAFTNDLTDRLIWQNG